MGEALQVICVRGQEVVPYVDDLAALRIKVFREYPYLYAGDLDYEKWYLQNFSRCAESVIVLVFVGEKVVGASTALPLKDEIEAFQKPFLAAGYEINKIFYFAESVLDKNYRGQNIGKKFFAERETAARAGGYELAVFSEVERKLDDSRRPVDWHPLDNFWQKLGYEKHPELKTEFPWQEIGETEESLKPMVFWMKKL